jgi:hypothetical protein
VCSSFENVVVAVLFGMYIHHSESLIYQAIFDIF